MYIDESKLTSAEFRRLWVIAFRGLVDIGLDVSFRPKTKLIAVNDNKTVTLPSDFIQWVKVGVLKSNGEIATMKINSSLSTAFAGSTDRITKIAAASAVEDLDEGSAGRYYLNFYDDEGGVSHLFGADSGLLQPGECRFDENNNCIVLETQFPYPYVALEYISAPEMDDDFTMDLSCQEAMVAWIAWRDIANIPRGKYGSPRERERLYINAKKIAKKRMKPFRIQIANQISREGTKLTAKA